MPRLRTVREATVHGAGRSGRAGGRRDQRMPMCEYGAACTRRDCIYRHPPKGTRPAEPESRDVCLAYLAGACQFGERCRNVHPTEQEACVLIAKYKRTDCQWGDACRTEGCLFLHPHEKVAARLAALGLSADGLASGAAAAALPENTVTPPSEAAVAAPPAAAAVPPAALGLPPGLSAYARQFVPAASDGPAASAACDACAPADEHGGAHDADEPGEGAAQETDAALARQLHMEDLAAISANISAPGGLAHEGVPAEAPPSRPRPSGGSEWATVVRSHDTREVRDGGVAAGAAVHVAPAEKFVRMPEELWLHEVSPSVDIT